MDPRQVLRLITDRHSIRRFTDEYVDDSLLEQILEAGRWAPSGKNNQAWRFVVVRSQEIKDRLSDLTVSGRIIKQAGLVLPVFIHKPSMYDKTKDHQSIGACLENMLLMAHGLGLGAVWLGEILKNSDKVRDVLGLDPDHELMAVLAMGFPQGEAKFPDRKSVDELIIARF